MQLEGVPQGCMSAGENEGRVYAGLDELDTAREPKPPSLAGSQEGLGSNLGGDAHTMRSDSFSSSTAVEAAARKTRVASIVSSTRADRDAAFFEEMARSREAERGQQLASMDTAQRERHLAAQAEFDVHDRKKSEMLGKQMKTYAKRSSATILSGSGSGRGRGARARHRRSTSSIT